MAAASQPQILIYKGINSAIRACLTEEKHYLLDSNFEAPVGDYSASKVMVLEPISWTSGAVTTPTDDTGVVSYESTYKAIVQLTFFGDNSFGRAQSVASGFREKQVRRKLIIDGVRLGYSKTTPVRDVSTPIDNTKIEERARFSVELFVVIGGADRGDDPSVIETVTTLTGNYTV